MRAKGLRKNKDEVTIEYKNKSKYKKIMEQKMLNVTIYGEQLRS